MRAKEIRAAFASNLSSATRGVALALSLVLLAGWGVAQTPGAPAAASSTGSDLSPGQPRITYSRSFKGSQPAFLQVIIAQNGSAEYEARESDDQPIQSVLFTASPATVSEVFQLARQADGFRKPLEDRHSKVSYMGTKMLAWDSPHEHHQQIYNYTRKQPAMALQELFEKIADTGEHTIKLRQAMRYDRLGVVKELNLIRIDWDQQQMQEPDILLPTLQQIANDRDLMGIARKRAAELVREMTNQKADASQK